MIMDEQEKISRYKWMSRYEELKNDAIKSKCEVFTFTRDQYRAKFKVSGDIANRDIKWMLIYDLIEEPKRKKGRFRVIC